jgi:hypothetical protein
LALGMGKTADGLARTTALSALLVDGGIVGIVLLVLAVSVPLFAVLRWQSVISTKTRVLVLSVSFCLLWTMVCNLNDLLLFQLFFIPCGIAWRIALPDDDLHGV